MSKWTDFKKSFRTKKAAFDEKRRVNYQKFTDTIEAKGNAFVFNVISAALSAILFVFSIINLVNIIDINKYIFTSLGDSYCEPAKNALFLADFWYVIYLVISVVIVVFATLTLLSVLKKTNKTNETRGIFLSLVVWSAILVLISLFASIQASGFLKTVSSATFEVTVDGVKTDMTFENPSSHALFGAGKVIYVISIFVALANFVVAYFMFYTSHNKIVLKRIEGLPLIKVEHLKKYFPVETNFFGKPTRWLKAVEDVSFELEKGKTLGIVGESGCGKTTLGRTILRLYDIQGGKVYFDGNDITDLKIKEMNKFRTRIQYVFQDPFSSLPPRLPVGEIIAQPVRIHHIVPEDQVKDYVLSVMRDCGLQDHFYDRFPHEFSGGQRQRICIARALAVKPELIILDEPVSALDVSIQAQIINLLRKLQEQAGFTYLFITHDISVVKYVSDEIAVMYLGSMVEKGSKESIFAEPLHPYTKALFSAVPIADPRAKMNRIILKGDIPSPSNPPKGCKFHTRCNECMEICKSVQPEFREVRPGHFCACHLYDNEKKD